MGKKKASEMQKQRESLSMVQQKVIRSSLAQELFEQMVKFAEYCF